jgi:hypothetical protein
VAGKRLAKEENDNSDNNRGEEEVEVTSAKCDPNPGSGSSNLKSGNCNSEMGIYHPESGNRNLDSSNSSPGKGNDRQEEESVSMDVNTVFTISAEFCAPSEDVTELALGAECVVFNKPENPGADMKSLFIRGHLDGTLVWHMLIDGGASINILPLSLFKKLGHVEGDFKRTNLSLSGFAGDPMEVEGIICKESTVGSKTVHMDFFMVDVKGCYNVLLGRDWIHANGCVPSTLHQCIIQWVGDEVEVVQVDEDVCITMIESQVDIQGGEMKCLTGRDLTGYDYVSVSKDRFVPISVKPTIGMTQLAHDLV